MDSFYRSRLDESHRYCVKPKKLETSEHKLIDSIYIKINNRPHKTIVIHVGYL